MSYQQEAVPANGLSKVFVAALFSRQFCFGFVGGFESDKIGADFIRHMAC
jgi:hypothetical protein